MRDEDGHREGASAVFKRRECVVEYRRLEVLAAEVAQVDPVGVLTLHFEVYN